MGWPLFALCYRFATIPVFRNPKDAFAQTICGLSVDGLHKVPVGVHGHLDAAVTHLSLDVLGMLPLCYEQTRICV